jgi:hypothetical protein
MQQYNYQNITYVPQIGTILEEITNGLEKNPIGRFLTVDDGKGRTAQVRAWGEANQLATENENLLEDSHILPSLLDTKQKILTGQRFYAYVETHENGVRTEQEVAFTPEEAAFFRQNEDYFADAAIAETTSGNLVVKYKRTGLPQNGKHPIVSLSVEPPKFWRKERQNETGEVETVWFRGDAWRNSGRAIPMPFYTQGNGIPEGNFVTWSGSKILFRDNYYHGVIWQGAKLWLKILAAIPSFHLNNLSNIYAPTMHIRIRKGYFLPKGYADANEKEKKLMKLKETSDREAFLREINNRMSGVTNAGRVIWSEQDVKSLESKYPDMEFIPLNLVNNEKTFMDLYETTERAVMSSVQISGSLANIQRAGSLSSGSDILYELEKHRVIHNPQPRNRILKPIYLVQAINGWDTTRKYGFKDTALVPRNESKTGKTDVTNG